MTTLRPRTISAIDTRSLVFWVVAALAAFGAVKLAPLIFNAFTGAPVPATVAFVAWALYAVVLLILIYRFATYERRARGSVAFAFIWGGVVAAGMGVIAAPASAQIWNSIPGLDEEWANALSAGSVEEPMKLLGVIALALIPGARVRSAADGLFYGVVVGLGFEVVESFLYSTQWETTGTEIGTVIAYVTLRGVIGGLWSHPTFSAIAGAGVGYFFGSTASAAKRWLVAIGSLAVAIALHAFYDSPVLESFGPVVATVAKGLPALVVALVVWRIARQRQRRALDAAARDLVPDDYVSPDDFAALATRSARRSALKEMRRAHGRAAARALSQVQRAQLDTLVAAVDDGIDSPAAAQAVSNIEDARALLAQAQAR